MVADETTLVRSCARAGVRIIIGRNMFDAGSLQVFVIRLQCWLRTCAAKREVKKRYRRALLARDKVGPCCPSYYVHPVVSLFGVLPYWSAQLRRCGRTWSPSCTPPKKGCAPRRYTAIPPQRARFSAGPRDTHAHGRRSWTPKRLSGLRSTRPPRRPSTSTTRLRMLWCGTSPRDTSWRRPTTSFRCARSCAVARFCRRQASMHRLSHAESCGSRRRRRRRRAAGGNHDSGLLQAPVREEQGVARHIGHQRPRTNRDLASQGEGEARGPLE